MTMNMSLSRRQKNATTSSTTGEPPVGFDVESSTRGLSGLNISPTPPPPFLPTHRSPPPEPEQRGRRLASYLWHAWKQYQSHASASLDEETTASAVAATAARLPSPNSGHSHNRHAPASADGVYALEDSQQQRRRRRPRAQKKLSRCDNGSGRRKSHWVRLKNHWFRISLVCVVGALAFDLYLVRLESRAGEQSARKGRLFSAAFSPSPRRTNEDARDAPFPGSSAQHSARFDDGKTRRSVLDRGTVTGTTPSRTAKNSPQTGVELKSPRITDDERIKPNDGQGATAADEAVAAAAAVGVRLGGLIPGESPSSGAKVQPQPLQHDPLQDDPFYGQRVAVVVPYVGRDLPVWWDAFAEQARLNDGLIDWVIFCDQASYRDLQRVHPHFYAANNCSRSLGSYLSVPM